MSENYIKYHIENFDQESEEGNWWYVDDDCQKVKKLSDKEVAKYRRKK